MSETTIEQETAERVMEELRAALRADAERAISAAEEYVPYVVAGGNPETMPDGTALYKTEAFRFRFLAINARREVEGKPVIPVYDKYERAWTRLLDNLGEWVPLKKLHPTNRRFDDQEFRAAANRAGYLLGWSVIRGLQHYRLRREGDLDE
jgi:hypothetical protein